MGKRQSADSDARTAGAATEMIGCIALVCMKIHDHGTLAAMAAATRQDPAGKIVAGRIFELFEQWAHQESVKSAFLFSQIMVGKEAA